MKWNSLILILVPLSCCKADFPSVSDEDVVLARRVINGTETSRADWKFMVAILKRTFFGNLIGKNMLAGRSGFLTKLIPYWQSCSGALIAPNWVITAGHCVVSPSGSEIIDPSIMLVRAGAHRLSTAVSNNNTDDVEVEKIYIRKSFKALHLPYGNDIALLKLKRALKGTPSIRIAPLPPAGLNYSMGTDCVAAGWGKTEYNQSSDVPMEVELPIYSMAQCASTWKIPKHAQDGRIICAIGNNFTADTCNGDSGGPLLCKLKRDEKSARLQHVQGQWVLAGLVSFGSKECAKPGVAAIYTSVSFHRHWIDATIKDQIEEHFYSGNLTENNSK